MTDIALVTAKIAGNFDTKTRSYKAAEAITAGAACYKTTAGLVGLCDASTGSGVKLQFRGIALNAAAAGDPVLLAYDGPVEGFTLSGNCEAYLYLSNDAGEIGDSAGDVSVIVGRIDMRDDGTKFLWVTVLPLTTWA